MLENFFMPDFTTDLRGDKTFDRARQNFFGDERGNCSVKSVKHDNATMMISGDNHARHCSEFVAADFRQDIKQAVAIGLVDFESTTDDFNLVQKFFVIDI